VIVATFKDLIPKAIPIIVTKLINEKIIYLMSSYIPANKYQLIFSIIS
jgi:hypothetical protein